MQNELTVSHFKVSRLPSLGDSFYLIKKKSIKPLPLRLGMLLSRFPSPSIYHHVHHLIQPRCHQHLHQPPQQPPQQQATLIITVIMARIHDHSQMLNTKPLIANNSHNLKSHSLGRGKH